MASLKFFSIAKLTVWVKHASNKIAHFLDFPAELLLRPNSTAVVRSNCPAAVPPSTSVFTLADNEYAASSRFAGKPKKSTLFSVQLPFLG